MHRDDMRPLRSYAAMYIPFEKGWSLQNMKKPRILTRVCSQLVRFHYNNESVAKRLCTQYRSNVTL